MQDHAVRQTIMKLFSSYLAIVLLTTAQFVTANDVPIVAAASDLQFALPEIAADFEAQTGHRVRLNFGSSGNFRRQITQGAPFELYLSADEDYVFALQHDGHTRDDGCLYAIGRIVIITPKNNTALVDEQLIQLGKKLARQELNRFAIANPAHAPYGVAAKQALEAKGLWTAIQPQLVLGENVSQAAQYALSGNTDGGIVAYSLALAPALRERAVFALIPAELHAPLRQRMVLMKDAGVVAEKFYAFLQTEPARVVLERYGFALPEEQQD